jgi:hypothetical protein
MRYAIIVNNFVYELFESPPEVHPSIEVVQVPTDDVQVGWVREGDNFAPPPPVPPYPFPDGSSQVRMPPGSVQPWSGKKVT